MSDVFQLSTIWAETADNARSAARTFVLGGLSEKHYGLSNFWVADRINVSKHISTSTLSMMLKIYFCIFMALCMNVVPASAFFI